MSLFDGGAGCGVEGTRLCCLSGQMALCLYPEQFRAIPWRIRCAWQPEGILDISFHVSVFLLSLPWARLCLWSWSLAQTRCYVGFYGGKKKHTGCQTWKSIKKGEEGSEGRVVRGVWGGEEMWSSCALKVESWFHPSLPIFELWGVGFGFPGVQSQTEVCESLTERCLQLGGILTMRWIQSVAEPSWCGKHIWGFTSTEGISARASGWAAESGVHGVNVSCTYFQTLPCLPQVFQTVSTKLCFFRSSFKLLPLSSRPHRGLHFSRCVSSGSVATSGIR